jgi:sugar O-acyltransferase (sialic acid O-acetyltransferase NeuD family)
MKKPELMLIGAGGHAQSCIDVVEQHGKYRIAGLVGGTDEKHIQVLGCPVIGTDDDLPQLANEYQNALIAVGQIDAPDSRMRLYRQACRLGFHLPVIVAPDAYISRHATLGAGTIIMHGATVNAGVNIGENCIVNSHALVEHGSVIGNHCHLSTGAILNGEAVLGDGTFIGSGSIIKEGVTLGQHCLVGMGLSLRHDLPARTRFLGRATI